MPEPQAGEKTLPDGALDVTLKDVHFSYEEDREILKGIGLNLPAGSFVSLVGESGCGKSTIAGILAAMLMCGKVTNDNLIDSSHYFRNTDQYEKLMWGFSYISFCLSKHFWESDVFVSFLLTASL